MRPTTTAIRMIATLMFLLFAFQYCSAEVLVSDGFDYDAGEIDGKDGGVGWSDTWLLGDVVFELDASLGVVEPETPLIYAIPGGGFINGGDKALGLHFEAEADVALRDGNAVTRPLEDIIDADEIYYSYLYQYNGDGTPEGGLFDNNDFVVWYFNSTGGPQMGLKANGGSGEVVDDFTGRVSGAFAPPQQALAPGVDISEEAGTLNDTWLVVGKVSRADHSDAEDDYDQFDLWINPAPGDAGAPHATATAVAEDSLQTELGSIGMRIFDSVPGGVLAMTWDELRVGETWEDVTGILGDQDVTIVNPPDPTCVVPIGGIAGDLDGDGTVAFADFLVLSQNFGGTGLSYEQGDIDCSGDVAFADFLVLSQNFGTSAGGAAVVPEPSSIMLCLWIGLLATIRKRR